LTVLKELIIKTKQMKAKSVNILIGIALTMLIFSGCKKDLDRQNDTVYYSEWFSPTAWQGIAGDWYFDASAPDLTADIVEKGVVLGYVWLDGDVYSSTSVRPLPAYAVGANWDFLIHSYGSIEFTSDMITQPLTSTNKFRFIAIPGTIPALKSASMNTKSVQELKSMSYKDVCKLYNIPE
jgi:hypothetical protein